MCECARAHADYKMIFRLVAIRVIYLPLVAQGNEAMTQKSIADVLAVAYLLGSPKLCASLNK